MLAGDDHIDVIARRQAVLGGDQQAVGIRREVDAHHRGALGTT
jgi:hypothetical protein